MNPMMKYTLARLGIFLAVSFLLVALPLPIHLYLRLAIAVLISAVLSWFLLRGLRDQVTAHVSGVIERRAAEKERLRTALAGEDERQPRSDGTLSNDGY